MDIDLPPAFSSRYPGPQFGIEGTRRLTGVEERPIIGTIIKPSVGLSPEQTAELVRELGEAGIDFIKDDELMADPPHSPLAKRVACVMRVINRLADRTGRKIMYAVNISDEVDAMKRHHDCVVRRWHVRDGQSESCGLCGSEGTVHTMSVAHSWSPQWLGYADSTSPLGYRIHRLSKALAQLELTTCMSTGCRTSSGSRMNQLCGRLKHCESLCGAAIMRCR